MTQFNNDFQTEQPTMATAVTEDNTPALEERQTHQTFCDQCNKWFSSRFTFNHHNKRVHSGLTEKPFKCHTCPKAFLTNWEVSIHVKHAHSENKPFKCSKCEHKSKTDSKLKSHLKTHDENRERFKCSICGVKLVRKSDLNRHFKRRHGSLNDEGNTKSDNSKNISKLCGNAQPDGCVNRFDGNSAGVTTTVTNDKTPALQERPAHKKFCEQCNKSFSTNWTLSVHNIRFHSAVTEKPFQCHICPKRCATRWERRLHLKHALSDTRPHTCPKCEYKCKSVSHFRVHLKAHDKILEKFKCSMCASEFVRKSELKCHLKSRHDSLNNERNSIGDDSQNISYSCGSEERNKSEASGEIVEVAAPGNVSRELYHCGQDGHVTVEHSTSGPGSVSTENGVELPLWGCFCGHIYFSHDDLESHWDENHKPA